MPTLTLNWRVFEVNVNSSAKIRPSPKHGQKPHYNVNTNGVSDFHSCLSVKVATYSGSLCSVCSKNSLNHGLKTELSFLDFQRVF